MPENTLVRSRRAKKSEPNDLAVENFISEGRQKPENNTTSSNSWGGSTPLQSRQLNVHVSFALNDKIEYIVNQRRSEARTLSAKRKITKTGLIEEILEDGVASILKSDYEIQE